MPFLIDQPADQSVTPDQNQQPNNFLIDQGNQPLFNPQTLDAVNQSTTETGKVNTLSKESGLSAPTVAQDVPGTQKIVRARKIDNQTQDTPAIRKWISDPNNMAVAHASVDQLSAMERISRSWERSQLSAQLGEAYFQAWHGQANNPIVQQHIQALQNRLAELGQDTQGGFVSYLASAAGLIGGMIQPFENPMAAARIGAATTLGAGVGALAGGIGAAPGALAGFTAGVTGEFLYHTFASTGGQVYENLLQAGVDKDTAGIAAYTVGAANTALMAGVGKVIAAPIDAAMKKLMTEGAIKVMSSKPILAAATAFAKQYTSAVAVGTSFGFLQELINTVGEEVARSITPNDVKGLTAEEVQQRLTDATLNMFKAMTVLAFPGAAATFGSRISAAKRAENNQKVLDGQNRQMVASELLKHSPDKLAEAETAILNASGIHELWVPGSELKAWIIKQDKPQELAVNLGVADKIDEAAALGQDVQIPADRAARYLIPHDNYQALSDHIKDAPTSMTPAEAKDYQLSGLQEDMKALMAQLPDQTKDEKGLKSKEPGAGTRPQQSHPAVDLAEHELGLKQFFQDAKDAGMTDTEYQNYLIKIRQAQDEAARRSLDAEAAQQQRELTADWQKKLQVEQEQAREHLSQQPVYQAINGIGSIRLDRKQAEEALRQMGLKLEDLPEQSRGRKLYTANQKEPGLNIDEYAQLHDINDGHLMLAMMAKAKPFRDAIEQIAYDTMLRKHGDLRNRLEAVIEARKSLHNDFQAEVLQTELNALRSATKAKRLRLKLVRNAAREYMRNMPLSEIVQSKFEAAETRLARAARKALRAGNREEAAQLKFQQVMNFHMAKEAIKIKEEIAKGQKYMEKFQRERKAHRAMPVEYLKAIRDLVGHFNFGPTPKAGKLDSVSAIMNNKIEPIKGFNKLISSKAQIGFKNMTLDRFRELNQLVKTIEKKGRDLNKFREAIQQRQVDVTVALLRDEINANLKKTIAAKNPTENRGVTAKIIAHAKAFGVLNFNFDTVVRQIDGWRDHGVTYLNTKGRIDRAYSRGYREDQIGWLPRSKKVAQDLNKLFSVFDKEDKKNIDKLITIPGTNRRLSRHTVIAAILNMGNEHNIKAMTEDSSTFSTRELKAIVDWAPKKYFDFAQSIWDYFDTYWPEIVEATQRRDNYTPEKVVPQALQTKYGTYRGGYYPVIYDRKTAIYDSTDVTDLMNDAKFGRAAASHTRRGHIESRTNPTGDPVKMDVYGINLHMNNVIYDLELGDAISDFYKVWYNKDFHRELANKGYEHLHEAGDIWLRDVIQRDMIAGNMFDRTLRALRTNMTYAALAFKASVGMLQVLGVYQSGVTIGWKHIWNGTRILMNRARKEGLSETIHWIYEQSGFMASRDEFWNKDLIRQKKALKLHLLDRVTPGQSAEFARDGAFFLIYQAQKVTDLVTWLGAYNKWIEAGHDHGASVDFADNMVARSQSSGLFKDRTAFERGALGPKARQIELVRSLTLLQGYYSAKFNIAYEKTRQVQLSSPLSWFKYANNIAMLYFIENIVAGAITGQLPSGNDKETVGHYILSQGLASIANGVVGLREIANDVRGFPAGGVIGRLSNDVKKAISDWSNDSIDEIQLLKDHLKALSDVVPLPAGAINEKLSIAQKQNKGKDVKPQEYIFGLDYTK